MRAIDIIIGAGWIVFWIYWLVAATGTKSGQGRWSRFAGFRVGIIFILLFLLRLKVLKGQTAHDPWLEGIGLALFVLGLGLAVWARIYIGTNWGTPMSRKDDPDLVKTGPYRTIRHPIYTGIILGMIGTAIAVSVYWLIAVVLVGGYFIYSAVNEERYMAELFPAAYPEYKRSTKMLIPFLL
jgi:protein-S-isoprenylcysteine O-methyltransferase Ste14